MRYHLVATKMVARSVRFAAFWLQCWA